MQCEAQAVRLALCGDFRHGTYFVWLGRRELATKLFRCKAKKCLGTLKRAPSVNLGILILLFFIPQYCRAQHCQSTLYYSSCLCMPLRFIHAATSHPWRSRYTTIPADENKLLNFGTRTLPTLVSRGLNVLLLPTPWRNPMSKTSDYRPRAII